MTQLRANRQALAAAVKANDVAQIHSLAAQQGNLQGQLIGIRSEARAKVYALLTPEQKAKADEMREKVRDRMKQRFEKRKGEQRLRAVGRAHRPSHQFSRPDRVTQFRHISAKLRAASSSRNCSMVKRILRPQFGYCQVLPGQILLVQSPWSGLPD